MKSRTATDGALNHATITIVGAYVHEKPHCDIKGAITGMSTRR